MRDIAPEIVNVHQVIKKRFLYQTYDMKGGRLWVSTKAYGGLDDAFHPDSFLFGSNAGRELCCV